jgi:hypothetical protein
MNPLNQLLRNFQALLPPTNLGLWQTLAIISVFSADIPIEFYGNLPIPT